MSYLNKMPRPQCATCGRPVTRMRCDSIGPSCERVLQYVIQCHGEEQTFMIRERTASLGNLKILEAFVDGSPLVATLSLAGTTPYPEIAPAGLTEPDRG